MSKDKLTLGYLGFGTGRHKPFDQVFPEGKLVTAEKIDEGVDIDGLVIWGGADISPSLYNDAVADMCGADWELSNRDYEEASACRAAIERDIPIIGVCRGAQLACAIAGGRLIQHVDNHGRTHGMTTDTGELIQTSSVHHQMMYPFDVEHKLLAWSSEKRSLRYIIGNNQTDPMMVDKPEPEIVWFPKIKALAIQGHPEFHGDPENDPFVQHCMKLVRQYVLGEQ
jgi:anthranilate/para-aminobenzoate synthase component II